MVKEIAEQKTKVEEAKRHEAEAKAKAKQQLAEMKGELQKQAAEMKGLQDQNKSLLEELALKKTEIA